MILCGKLPVHKKTLALLSYAAHTSPPLSPHLGCQHLQTPARRDDLEFEVPKSLNLFFFLLSLRLSSGFT